MKPIIRILVVLAATLATLSADEFYIAEKNPR